MCAANRNQKNKKKRENPKWLCLKEGKCQGN